MPDSTHSDAAPPATARGTVTRATDGVANDTAEASLASSLSMVMKQVHELQTATEGYLGDVNGRHSRAIDFILRHQRVQLDANIALLGQRYEARPHPARSSVPNGRHPPITRSRRGAGSPASIGLLPKLVAQHLRLLGEIDSLIAQRPDGRRGELILTEVARNHEEMAWTLTSLLKEDESVRGQEPAPVAAGSKPPFRAEARRRNGSEPGLPPTTPGLSKAA